ncbi:putative adaptor protein complex, sigma subunit [Helianthus annuus]|uniref:AP complex subunit sigma n=1 Tax=Helianthus annuus TaxID=4232 RepID=A0A251S3M1_HELAN|nr:AP-3 complex subunit sigma [Helianthus annuus]KAF5762331.1 putative adaptor protein complex, sigma subunit [Helianthus annuus]KAJ0646714.1 putative adaptor protein complex, sigma subunit [Helianthus annuus]
MILAMIVINNQGKPRLAKFYNYTPVEQQQHIIRSIYSVLCLQPENVTNFIEGASFLGPDTRLVYKLFATLYFVFVFDSSENELAMFDLIQVYVETLEKCFNNVCELDIVLNYSKMHTILDEMILGGQVVETNSEKVMQAVEEISKLEKVTTATKLISKSASLLWG